MRKRPANMSLWWGNGEVASYKARIPAEVEVSLGLTGRGEGQMGFIIYQRGNRIMDFVLDRDQVAELGAYLARFLTKLSKPRGGNPLRLSPAAKELMSMNREAARIAKSRTRPQQRRRKAS
jgi:hypothetical protein